MPNLNPIFTKQGCFDADIMNTLNSSMCQGLVANTTPVTNANPTSATTMIRIGVETCGEQKGRKSDI